MGKFRFRRRKSHGGENNPKSIPLKALVPNLVTSIAACAGITSISLCSEGRFREALVALLIACVCDGMDGRLARLLNASSKLGAELDSLADFVNFGVAPAMFMYYWLTGGPAHVGCDQVMVRAVLACSLFYAMCDCFRLARFNTMLETEPLPYWKPYFTGVPAPGGCWMVLTPFILLEALKVQERWPKIYEIFSSPYGYASFRGRSHGFAHPHDFSQGNSGQEEFSAEGYRGRALSYRMPFLQHLAYAWHHWSTLYHYAPGDMDFILQSSLPVREFG